jgi:hypothetical protein
VTVTVVATVCVKAGGVAVNVTVVGTATLSLMVTVAGGVRAGEINKPTTNATATNGARM